MNEENIKLGECACCHKKLASTKKGIQNFLTNSIIRILPMSIDKLRDECDVPPNRLQKTTQKTNSANIVLPTK